MSVQTACLLSIEYLSLADYSELDVPYGPAKKEGRELIQEEMALVSNTSVPHRPQPYIDSELA